MNKSTEMKRYVFTFCSGGPLGGRCQVIEAKSAFAARLCMVDHHGVDWAFQYSEEEWDRHRDVPNQEVPLEHVLRAKNLCPVCLNYTLHPDDTMNALSRTDNKTYVCSDCGIAEAMEVFNSEV